MQNFSCSVDCEGMYADIQKIEEYKMQLDKHGMIAKVQGKTKENRDKILKLVNEYNAYKKNKLHNFRFHPAKRSTNFGKYALASNLVSADFLYKR